MSGPVAIIEDDRDILDLLIDFLADHGIEAASVSPRPDVIAKLPVRPAAVLIDVMLPGTSGIEVAGQINCIYPGMPMVAMSASRLMLELAVATNLFDAHLAKPFDLPLLLEAVRAALAMSRQVPSFAAT